MVIPPDTGGLALQGRTVWARQPIRLAVRDALDVGALRCLRDINAAR
jgi:hypothetical protein